MRCLLFVVLLPVVCRIFVDNERSITGLRLPAFRLFLSPVLAKDVVILFAT